MKFSNYNYAKCNKNEISEKNYKKGKYFVTLNFEFRYHFKEFNMFES